MNEPEQKLTPAQIAEKQEIIKQKYEEDVKEKEQQILNLQNKLADKDNEIFELQKTNQNLAQDRDEWKTEAHRNRRIEQAKQATKEQNDFKTEYIKLQEQKGWKWSEERGWTR